MESNASFKADFAKLLQKAGDKVAILIQKTCLELQTSMVEMAPVDSGRFKNNWQVGLGSINTDTSAPPDKSGTGSISRAKAALVNWKAGETIYLTNSLPYAYRLEYEGWSKQAPSGFVRLTVQNYAQALKKAVESIK